MHRGPAGAGVLNERLQGALTPAREGAPERRFGGRVYRVGDKVMQLRNNYDKGTAGVFNGSVGQVTAISLEDQELRVLLDEDEEVAYGFDELDELTHAYAVSIHRSQGSEYPCVVVALTMSAWLMLQRNLLYTAVTRAKQLVVLVGSRRAGQGRPHPGCRPPLHRPHPTAPPTTRTSRPRVIGRRRQGSATGSRARDRARNSSTNPSPRDLALGRLAHGSVRV
jgi:exodeoxyribonuclease V alpha subunit